jgi:serine/threonine-protein kinase ATR
MAPASQGHVNGNGHQPPVNGHDAARLPPSTLAAQAVEDLSETASFSRSDETAELKRLSVVIERIKNQPGLLETVEDRIEHNNMLIYVYSRVVLEGPKWEDESVDPAHLRAEALKALEFLRVTIKEAPAVLQYRTDGSALLFRGSEPLWAWLLPKVMNLLGQEKCDSIIKDLKSFCQFLLETAVSTSGAEELFELLIHYFRANIDCERPHS